MKDVMIDLETLGTSADSVWLSIAAVQFDLVTGEIGEQFYMTVDLASAQKAGRKISPSTLEWWLNQRPEIMKKMLRDGRDLEFVLRAFNDWFYRLELLRPWGNSALFDLGMLTNTYEHFNIDSPWKHYNERCYRTIASLIPIGSLPKDQDLAHDPIYDCKYQIENLHRVYKLLNVPPFNL